MEVIRDETREVVSYHIAEKFSKGLMITTAENTDNPERNSQIALYLYERERYGIIREGLASHPIFGDAGIFPMAQAVELFNQFGIPRLKKATLFPARSTKINPDEERMFPVIETLKSNVPTFVDFLDQRYRADDFDHRTSWIEIAKQYGNATELSNIEASRYAASGILLMARMLYGPISIRGVWGVQELVNEEPAGNKMNDPIRNSAKLKIGATKIDSSLIITTFGRVSADELSIRAVDQMLAYALSSQLQGVKLPENLRAQLEEFTPRFDVDLTPEARAVIQEFHHKVNEGGRFDQIDLSSMPYTSPTLFVEKTKQTSKKPDVPKPKKAFPKPIKQNPTATQSRGPSNRRKYSNYAANHRVDFLTETQILIDEEFMTSFDLDAFIESETILDTTGTPFTPIEMSALNAITANPELCRPENVENLMAKLNIRVDGFNNEKRYTTDLINGMLRRIGRYEMRKKKQNP